MSAMTLDITRLGAEGDGIAETANAPVYVPFAHPGDRLKVAVEKSQGTIMGDHRALARPHRTGLSAFRAGWRERRLCGCSLQHVTPALYASSSAASSSTR